MTVYAVLSCFGILCLAVPLGFFLWAVCCVAKRADERAEPPPIVDGELLAAEEQW